jgi:hypothetical protein
VVVACGAEWHVGHFFCAECGDVRFPRIFEYEPVLTPFIAFWSRYPVCREGRVCLVSSVPLPPHRSAMPGL